MSGLAEETSLLQGRGIERVSLRTPTLPPATHTNAYLVGRRDFLVVEPASPYPHEQSVLEAAIARRAAEGHRPLGMLVTHHHRDHVGGAAALRAKLGLALWAHPDTRRKLKGVVEVDRTVEEGGVVDAALDDLAVEVLHTPGHAPGHLCLFSRREGWAIVGDMVASVGTILIDPDDEGDMVAYLRELARLRGLEAEVLLPAHGDPIEDASARLGFYIAHREAREAKVFAAVEAGARELGEVVARAYDDTPVMLWPLAAKSARAHLARLVTRGMVRAESSTWVVR